MPHVGHLINAPIPKVGVDGMTEDAPPASGFPQTPQNWSPGKVGSLHLGQFGIEFTSYDDPFS